MAGCFQRQPPKIRRAAGLQSGFRYSPFRVRGYLHNHSRGAMNRIPGFGGDVGKHAARDSILFRERPVPWPQFTI